MSEAATIHFLPPIPMAKFSELGVAQTAERTYTGLVSNPTHEGELEMTDSTATPAKTPRGRTSKAQNVPDAGSARDASVLDGVRAADHPEAPAKPAPRTARKGTPAKPTTKAPASKTAPSKSPKTAEPKATPEAKVDRRQAKQDLARRVVQAAADLFNGQLQGDEAFLAGLTKDEAEAAVAQWLHHLPTGNEGDQRWWAQGLPKPDRSDWR